MAILAELANEWRDELGRFAKKGYVAVSVDGALIAEPETLLKAREQAMRAMASVPKPSQTAVIAHQADALLAKEGWIRAGGERRGNSEQRAERLQAMADIWGDGEIMPCVYTGVMLAGNKDAAIKYGLEMATQDKLVVGPHGGGYTIENLVPSSRAANQSRGDSTPEWLGSPEWGDPASYASTTTLENTREIALQFQKRRKAIRARRRKKGKSVKAPKGKLWDTKWRGEDLEPAGPKLVQDQLHLDGGDSIGVDAYVPDEHGRVVGPMNGQLFVRSGHGRGVDKVDEIAGFGMANRKHTLIGKRAVPSERFPRDDRSVGELHVRDDTRRGRRRAPKLGGLGSHVRGSAALRRDRWRETTRLARLRSAALSNGSASPDPRPFNESSESVRADSNLDAIVAAAAAIDYDDTLDDFDSIDPIEARRFEAATVTANQMWGAVLAEEFSQTSQALVADGSVTSLEDIALVTGIDVAALGTTATWWGLVEKLLADPLGDIILDAAVGQGLATGLPFNPFNVDIYSVLDHHLSGLKSYGGWSRDKMYEWFSKGIEDGMSVQQMSQVLRTEGPLSDRASTLWARTELVAAANGTTWEQLVSAGATTKRWIATPDRRTRDSHLDAETDYAEGGPIGPIPIRSDFQVGESFGRYPGDPRLRPEERINCRCRLIGTGFDEPPLVTKTQLQGAAKERDIPGYMSMSKPELIDAILVGVDPAMMTRTQAYARARSLNVEGRASMGYGELLRKVA